MMAPLLFPKSSFVIAAEVSVQAAELTPVVTRHADCHMIHKIICDSKLKIRLSNTTVALFGDFHSSVIRIHRKRRGPVIDLKHINKNTENDAPNIQPCVTFYSTFKTVDISLQDAGHPALPYDSKAINLYSNQFGDRNHTSLISFPLDIFNIDGKVASF